MLCNRVLRQCKKPRVELLIYIRTPKSGIIECTLARKLYTAETLTDIDEAEMLREMSCMVWGHLLSFDLRHMQESEVHYRSLEKIRKTSLHG